MTTFFVAPYRPEDRESIDSKTIQTTSHLIIDSVEYKNLLQIKWSGIRISQSSEYVLLEWFFPVMDGWAGPIGGLDKDKQTIFLDTPFEEFFLWHRSIIPDEYKLFLFHDGSWKNLELKPDTGLEEIQQFCGKQSN